MFSCLQILEAFLWFVLITLLNVTLIILTLSVSRLLNLLLRLVAFLLFLNPQCLASISRWITASSFSIVIGSKHITLNATGGGFLTASKQFRHGATSKSRSNTASNSTKHK